MLVNQGQEVTEAASAEAAVRLMDDGLVPGLVVTHHLMPGMTGTELVAMLKVQIPALPVLMVSGYAEVDGGASDLPRLTIPFRWAELAASLRRLGLPTRGPAIDSVPGEIE